MTQPGFTSGQSNNNISFNRMLFISVVIHAIALSLIFFSPSLPTPKVTFGPVHYVELISSSEFFLNVRSLSLDSGEIRDKILREQSLIVKKQAGTAQNLSIRRIETAHKDSSAIEKIIDDIRKRVSTSEATPFLPKNQGDEKQLRSEMDIYYSTIWAKIKEQWALPQSIILPKENIEAVVHMKILKNGSVEDIYFEKRSGNRYFDESAIRAVRKAAPFPPLPERIRNNYIEIGIRFHSREFQ